MGFEGFWKRLSNLDLFDGTTRTEYRTRLRTSTKYKNVCSLTVPFLSIPKPFYQSSFFPFALREGGKRKGERGEGRDR